MTPTNPKHAKPVVVNKRRPMAPVDLTANPKHLAYEACLCEVYERMHNTLIGRCTKPIDHEGIHSPFYSPSPYLPSPSPQE